MRLVFFILLCATAITFNNADAENCNLIENKSPSIRLLRHLFCDYDPSERPVKDPRNATTIKMRLYPKIVKYDASTNTMHLHTWYQIVWMDEYLQWNVSDFDGMDELIVPIRKMWSPDIFIEEATRTDRVSVDISNNQCMLYHTGNIICIPAVLLSTRCDVDYTHWPFEKPNCHVEFSSWSYRHNEITIITDALMIITKNTYTHVEWAIESVDRSHVNKKSKFSSLEEFPAVIVNFTLERNGNRLWIMFGIPTFILAAMTLTTLWMDPKSNERLMIACINFFCHFLCIGSLRYIVPQSHTIPNILMFYHDSIILAVVALILTCLLRRVIDVKDPPPLWISFLVSKIMTSKLAQILSLSILDPRVSARLEEDANDNRDLVNCSVRKKSSWIHVATILGWISFTSFSLAYIILFVKYL